MIARLEPEAALRELVHPPQQVDGALQHVREVEQRSLVERVPVLRERDREHPPDAAREDDVQVAAERADDVLDRRGRAGAASRDAASRPRRRDSRRCCRDGSARSSRSLPSAVRKCALTRSSSPRTARVVRRPERRRAAAGRARAAGSADGAPARRRGTSRAPPDTPANRSISASTARRQTASASRSAGPRARKRSSASHATSRRCSR